MNINFKQIIATQDYYEINKLCYKSNFKNNITFKVLAISIFLYGSFCLTFVFTDNATLCLYIFIFLTFIAFLLFAKPNIVMWIYRKNISRQISDTEEVEITVNDEVLKMFVKDSSKIELDFKNFLYYQNTKRFIILFFKNKTFCILKKEAFTESDSHKIISLIEEKGIKNSYPVRKYFSFKNWQALSALAISIFLIIMLIYFICSILHFYSNKIKPQVSKQDETSVYVDKDKSLFK